MRDEANVPKAKEVNGLQQQLQAALGWNYNYAGDGIFHGGFIC